MKHGTFSLEQVLNNLSSRINPDQRINEINLEGIDRTIKIYNLQGYCYISVHTLEDIFKIFLDIPKNEIIRDFIREMINIYSMEEEISENNKMEVELCRIDHLTDTFFTLICKKYAEISKVEDDSIFGRIDISHDKISESLHSINNEYPFEQNWIQNDFPSIMNNIYKANNFLDIPKPQNITEDPIKKYQGRGRSRIKQVNIKDRPFICEYPECKRAFKRFEHLKRHNKMHTGERPYRCKYPGCMKSFSRSDNLAQHFKIHNVSTKSQSLTFRNYYETNKEIE